MTRGYGIHNAINNKLSISQFISLNAVLLFISNNYPEQ